MCIKHAAGRIPAGGGKGGIAADPRSLSRAEFERLCRAYIRGLQPAGPGVDVPGADIGTDLQTMAWMLDEYESITGGHAPAAINDKPSILGGTLRRFRAPPATGCSRCSRRPAGKRASRSRAPASPYKASARSGTVLRGPLSQRGLPIVAVSDVSGGFFDGDGLDVDALLDHARQTGGLEGYPHATALGNAELLECDCDVLIPAAVQGVIDENNAEAIRASVIVEAANAPVTVEADALLAERGITVVPDVLANAGSVHLCQMERTQGLSDNYWDRDTIDRLRRKRLVGAYRAAVNTAARHDGASARLGAWINALGRIEEAVKLRGWC
ncbi:MAG: Glu/Leu/Phe/Val dehydrogenase dimerization domain-containing protein [Halioglobus sp.]|nr:Glu/Leu/Phe/Val dehydrogenase dimerization domain-containing protein [Halioglobus sp.]